MSLPLGMVMRLLANKEIAGNIGDLYNSIKSLNKTYLESSKNLDPILNPEPPRIAFESPLSLTSKTVTDSAGKGRNWNIYMCPYREKNQYGNKDCSSSGSGFVKGLVTYMVMDNLEVKPLSTISSLALLNSSNIQDLNSLEEIVVRVGAAEGLKLLDESMQSKNVLTIVFLAKRSKRRI